jgi:pimeloyl-ACP methyl ester carboxylesterase
MPPRRCTILLVFVSLSCGCVGTGNRSAPPPPPVYPVERASGVVYCADGSGGPGGTTAVLQEVVAHVKAPLRVEMVDWSHGRGRYMADHLHWKNIESSGERLAQQTIAFRQRYPSKRICYVGQSAGCAVVLVAAEKLPAGYVDRIVLLAASVSTRYDLRPSLRHAKEGIDNFSSRDDWFVLGLGMALSGTTDRDLAPAAGRVGFRQFANTPQDRAVYAKLREHPWEPSVSWTGNTGGHFGPSNPGHLQEVVIPMLLGKPRR